MHDRFERRLLGSEGRAMWKSRLLIGGTLLLALTLAVARIWQQPPTIDSGETAHTWPIVTHMLQGEGYTVCFPQYFPFCNQANQETGQREPIPVLLFAGIALFSHSSLLVASLINVLIIAVVSVFYMAVNSMVRYLVPVMPLTIVLSAIGVASLWRLLPSAVSIFETRRFISRCMSQTGLHDKRL